ncbi:unnamed protein product [Penicillium egyptiacum]|uniref:N-acetyltransferase domain-containing protein n=1 Tax=Penicillium egyptiacum TaxID=1303716 RepID=A0A9W4P7G4_9EURO|nr:unnamed protein product [Penicillium egyptiacum]
MGSDSSSDQGTARSDAFQPENLEFVGYNARQHDLFFNSIQEYSSSIINFCAFTPRPMDIKFTSRVAKHLQRNSNLFVIIYKEIEPIGTLFLESPHRDMAHHRCSELGIGILTEYQYHETEAVERALNWAFDSAGLHRVEMNLPSWNMRVGKLCEKFRFQKEGTRKECLFKDGEWWDEVNMAILEKDWKQRQIEMKR